MATIGSKKITTLVVPADANDGKELIVDFRSGLATVPKKVKRFLLERSPELYFDPLKGDNGGTKFPDDYAALDYYIQKIKRVGNPAMLCSVLKGNYETLQGELMSGKFNVKQDATLKKKEELPKDEDDEADVKKDVFEDAGDDEEMVTGAGDKIKSKKSKE